ncbi:MAG: methyltransferase domain-containing protein, partial [Myxococcota bacterium]|nr:methyltransferase domain-containing protein [Myxococcota bacterium]
MDVAPGPGVDVVADFLDVSPGSLPFDNDVFDEMLAINVLDQLRDPTALMSELYRIARPGCQLVVQLPYGSSDEAWVDPGSVRPYFLDSFGCFGQPYYWFRDQGYTGDWQLAFVIVKMSRERFADVTYTERLRAIHETRNAVKEMTAILMAMKPPRPQDRNL